MSLWKSEIVKIQTLSDSFRRSGLKFVENFCSFNFAGDLVINDEDEEEIDFEPLEIENSNRNDESEIN